jgi:hypothetical protein
MSIFPEQVRIYAEPEPGVSPILVRVWLENPSKDALEISLSATIAGGKFLPVHTTLSSQSTQVANLLGGALKIIPWDLQQPMLYDVNVFLSPDKKSTWRVGFRRLRWSDLAKTLSLNNKSVTLESLRRVNYSETKDISEVLDGCDAQGEGVILCTSVKEFPEAVALLANHASILVWQLTDTEIDETMRRSLARLDETRPVWG